MVTAPAKQIADTIWNFLEQEKALDLLTDVIRHLKAKNLTRENQVIVASQSPLTTAQRAKIIRLIKTKFRVKSQPEFVTDSSILGGILIKVGDRVLDLTVNRTLEHLINKSSI